MEFIIRWIISYCLIMFTMCLDNILWIPDSPEWKSIRSDFKVINFLGREYGIPKNKASLYYCWTKRIIEVLKHPRDIIPGIVSSLILALIWR